MLDWRLEMDENSFADQKESETEMAKNKNEEKRIIYGLTVKADYF